MRLVCPECGAHGSLAQFASDAEWRAAAELLAGLDPAIGTPLVGYLGLFRPAQRALTPPRVHRLLAELAEFMKVPYLHRHGQDWPVTQEMWRQALEQMVDGRDRLTLPLKSHGYLLEIVSSKAQKAEDKAAASAEERHDRELRAGFKAGRDAPARLDQAARVASAVASENAARKRLKMPPLSDTEIPEFLTKEGLS